MLFIIATEHLVWFFWSVGWLAYELLLNHAFVLILWRYLNVCAPNEGNINREVCLLCSLGKIFMLNIILICNVQGGSLCPASSLIA